MSFFFGHFGHFSHSPFSKKARSMENKKPGAPSGKRAPTSSFPGLTPLPTNSPLDGLTPLPSNDPLAGLTPLGNNDPFAGLTPLGAPQAINGLTPLAPPSRPAQKVPTTVDGLTALSPPTQPVVSPKKKSFRGTPKPANAAAVADPLAGLTPLNGPMGTSLDPLTGGGAFPDLDSLDPLAASAQKHDELDEADAAAQRMLMRRVLPAVGTSSFVHALAVVIMAFMTLPNAGPSQDVVVVASDTPEEMPDLDALFDPEINELKLDEDFGADDSNSTANEALSKFEFSQAADIFEGGDFQAGTETVMNLGGGFDGTIFAGRSGESKKELLKKSGGSSVTEKAVNNALKWLANHQAEDGSWNFDHKLDNTSKKCICSKPGDLVDCRTGATAMALLPFLGAGHTPQGGPYRENVEKGLYYLVSQVKVEDGTRGNLAQGGGSLYSHGLAAITLCEAYAMTKDKGLKEPAQLALNHTVYAQASDGGWRYAPKQLGDTSAVGWQLMALKSGRMGYLNVPDAAFVNAGKFLDTMQTKQGSHYGYDKPGEGEATTAVGLLCRMYTGWKKDHPPLKAGAKWISDRGPSKTSMYFNYYATQVMRHLDDQEQWPKWNREMRSFLTDSQEDNDIKHTFGSWYFKGDPFADRGGRLYHTSLATMILEVYYRHLPIYSDEAAKLETFK
jgi:hypothetical protein